MAISVAPSPSGSYGESQFLLVEGDSTCVNIEYSHVWVELPTHRRFQILQDSPRAYKSI